jgi:hypothetical protein
MISEVDINDVSISQDDEIENIESDEDINIDSKIKRSREDDKIDDMKGIVLKKFLDENGREYPLTGGKTRYDARVFFDDEDSDELNEEEERLIMEDQQEQLIDKDEFDCDSEYQYSGGKDKAALYKMEQEHYKQIINEDREENNNNNNLHLNKDIFPKHIFLYHRRSFPRKKIIKYKFKTHEEFDKETLIVAIKKELCDCLDETLK